MKGLILATILILSSFVPSITIAETEPAFEKSFFDGNGNGLDDKMEPLIAKGEDIGVIILLNAKPSEKHFQEIKSMGLEINHVYKYIDAIRVDKVPAKIATDLTTISDLRLVEWQAPIYPMLDTAVKAIKVRDSDEYSPVAWDKELYGEGINVAVLDTG